VNDDDRSELLVALVIAIVPAALCELGIHYRWAVERRDAQRRQRERDFKKRLNKALDEALAKDRAK
jgi:hypothetical protein